MNMEFEIENTKPFILAPPRMKYLGIDLIDYVQGLYEENYKTDFLKIEELYKRRGTSCSILLGCEIFPTWYLLVY